MKNSVLFQLTTNPDGSLTIPAMLTTSLGIGKLEDVVLTAPLLESTCVGCLPRCLQFTPICPEVECCGYTTEGDSLNLPPHLLAEAGIPLGAELDIIAEEGLIIIADHIDEFEE